MPLYLLDTDIPENRPEDRLLTSHLYGGDHEHRLKQELLLGIGGMRLIESLGIQPDVYHYNEGHAAFAGLERLRILIQEAHISFDEALEMVRASSLFTVHTPLPAGNDIFSEELLRVYLAHHADLFNISWERLMQLGRVNPNNPAENFSMNVLAIRLSSKVNGVSRLHGKVSRRMFADLWKGYMDDELPIGHITNGVHYPTWTSAGWQQLLGQALGEKFPEPVARSPYRKKLEAVPGQEIWDLHMQHKRKLLEKVKELVMTTDPGNPYIRSVKEFPDSLDERALVIGFARRIVTYKRPSLLFRDRERLASILKKARVLCFSFLQGKRIRAIRADMMRSVTSTRSLPPRSLGDMYSS